MKNYQENSKLITTVIQDYFLGIFEGDIQRLKQVLHPKALLHGDVGKPYLKTVDEYLDIVANRKSPKSLGETFRMEINSLDIINGIAVARLSTPMYGFAYLDYLSLCRIEDKWIIVGKIFTDINQ